MSQHVRVRACNTLSCFFLVELHAQAYSPFCQCQTASTCDVQPENVVFREPMSGNKRPSNKHTVKLVDFGLARPYSESRSVKARLGSPGFMAPEVIRYERHTPAMDIYSLGVLLFVMLTGHKPMRSEEAHKLAYDGYAAKDYPKMQTWTWKRLSRPAQDIVLRMLARDPQIRITAAEVCGLMLQLYLQRFM